MLVTAKFDLHLELPKRKPSVLLSFTVSSTIKMALLNPANHLPINLQMGNLLLETTINFFIAIVNMFYIS